MIIFLSEVQKEHLSIIHKHSAQVLVDFCKLAIDYLNVGPNTIKNNLAAEKLSVSPLQIQNSVQALVYLLVEGSKHNISDDDFKSSLAITGFSLDKQEVLVKLYRSKKTDISNVLSLIQQKLPSYEDLHWRFGVKVASKNTSEQLKPIIELDIVLVTPKSFGRIHEKWEDKISATAGIKSVTSLNIHNSIPEARTASQCQNNVEHVLLQFDIPNLVHLTNTLEQALKESKSQHVRKVQRAL